MLDIVSIGDTTHDIFLSLPEGSAEVNCGLDKNECKLLLGYGDKLPVSRVENVYGVGNAANNAIGIARLGINNAIYTHLGNDESSTKALAILEEEKVGLDYIKRDMSKTGNMSVVLNYQGERVIFVHHEDWNYNLPDLGPIPFVYYTSVSENHESLNDQISDYVVKHNSKLIFNPGTHQLIKGKESLSKILRNTYALILNKLEAGRLLDVSVSADKKDDEECKKLLLGLSKLGPKIVVITQGSLGTYAYSNNEYYFVKPNDVPVVERTGAGDAFSTGFVYGCINAFDLKVCLVTGVLNSESVLGFVGARKGLLTLTQMKEKVTNYKGNLPTAI